MASGAWIEYQLLDDVLPAKRNPRQHDIDEIKASITRFGYTSPLIVNEKTGELVAGHGRIEALKAARDEGQPAPRLIKVVNDAWHVPVVRGVEFDNEHEAEAYLLADNKLTELTTWIDDELAQMLQDIGDVTGTLEGTGFDESELVELLDSIGTQESGLRDSSTKEIDVNEFNFEHKCPKCGFEWDG